MRRKERRRAPEQLGLDVPPELLDPDHQIWHDQRAYHRYMNQRGWTMPPAERIGCTTAPANRRMAAAAGWARETGIATRTYGPPNSPPHPEWRRLRELGLCG